MEIYGQIKQWSSDRYFTFARKSPMVRWVHRELRRRRHVGRYGVDSSFMFSSIELEINSMCNRRCSYCPNVSARRPSGYMSNALFEKIIGELSNIEFDGRVSYHFYGEPLLDKRLPRLIETTKNKVPGAQTEVYSNGDFLTIKSFRALLDSGLDNMLITQHDNEMPANLQEVMDSLTPEERRHIFIRFAEDRNLINRSGLVETQGEAETTLDGPLNLPCNWPLSIIVVTLQGNVVLCCNDYFETEVIGSLKERSIVEIWTDEKFVRFREALARGDRQVSKLCHKCDYMPDQKVIDRIVA